VFDAADFGGVGAGGEEGDDEGIGVVEDLLDLLGPDCAAADVAGVEPGVGEVAGEALGEGGAAPACLRGIASAYGLGFPSMGRN
jgi:hypothetical protein